MMSLPHFRAQASHTLVDGARTPQEIPPTVDGAAAPETRA